MISNGSVPPEDGEESPIGTEMGREPLNDMLLAVET